MGLGKFLLSRVAGHYKMNDAKNMLDSMSNLGQPSEHALPMDLLPTLVREAVRGLYNTQFYQSNRDWVLPYWAVRQYDPSNASFLPRMNAVGLNSTQRNWTAIGVLGGTIEPVVDPRGLVTPCYNGWSLDTWFQIGDDILFPSRRNDAVQTAEDGAPIVITRFKTEKAFIEMESFAASMRGTEVVFHSARVQNLTQEELTTRVFFSIRPYNPEGVSLVSDIRFDGEGGFFFVNGRPAVILTEDPESVFCSNLRDGDCSFSVNEQTDKREAKCDAGLASAFARFSKRIGPGEVAEFLTVMPIQDAVKPKAVKELRRFDYRDHRTRVRNVWEEKIREGMTVTLPDESLERCFRQNKAYLCLLDDGDHICPGPLTYHHYWFRDSAYMIAALDKMGYTESAERKLLNYPKRQDKNGFFLSQEGEWDSNGEAIWTLVEHFRLTDDKKYLEQVYKSIGKGAYWIEKKRQTTKSKKEPHSGLLPPGFSAEHFGPNDYFYWDDFWGLAGLRDAAFVSELLGYRTETLNFEKYLEDFWTAIRSSLKSVEDRLGGPCIPTSPYRRLDSAAIGAMAGVYPLRLFEPDDPHIVNTVNFLRKNCFIADSFFHDMTHSGINVYLSLHIAQVLIAQRDEYAYHIARDLLSRATGTLTWPEAIHPQIGGGCMGDGHHGWAVADWLLFIRNLLLMEQADSLVITPLVPLDWVDWGKRIRVSNAPTHFGPVSYTIEGRQNEVVLQMKPRFRKAPRHLIWRLPFTAYDALADNKAMNVNADAVQVPGGTTEIRVRRTGVRR